MALADPPGLSSPWRRRLNEVSLAVSFLTRLPWIPTDWSPPLMSAAWAFPWAGALLGLLCGTVAAVFAQLGASPWLAAILALGASMLLTGCLHEDGIADTADGVGSGRDRTRSLEILRDSRIGTYGMVAVLFSVLIRIAALAMLIEVGSWLVVVSAWALAAALGRGVGPGFTLVCPPARSNGVGAGAGRPSGRAAVVALVTPLLAGMVLTPWPSGVVALVAAMLPAAWLGWLARRRLGGYTGDVIGAAILLVECTALVFLALAWGAEGVR